MTGQDKVQLPGGETIYAGRDDDNQREGVGILMSKKGSRKGRGTKDQVFILHKTIKPINEWQATL